MGHLTQVRTFPSRRMSSSAPKQRLWKTGIVAALVACLYFPILSRLVAQCWNDANWSHAFLVPAFSLFLVWRQRDELARQTPDPSAWGLPILVWAMGVLIVGVLGAELFLSRISLLILLAGMIVSFLGWRYFRPLLFPWAFLILMIPIPDILLNQIAFPLQILASKTAAILLPLVGVPVLREGNIITLPAMPLEVAEACSGIRSLVSLITLAVVYGFFTETSKRVRVLLVVASIPIAVVANSLRIVGTGMLAQYWDPSKAQGFFHEFSGWLIFLVSLAFLAGLHRILRLANTAKARPHES